MANLESLRGRVIGVVGHKDTGKTGVVEGLVKFLKARGYSVGTVKHVHGPVAMEPEATDSGRHLAAGADCTVVVSAELVQVNLGQPAAGRVAGPADAANEALERAARHLAACDYVIVEGFKRAEIPKVVVTAKPGDLPEGLTQVVAYVGEGAKAGGGAGSAPGAVPAFSASEIDGLGKLLFDKQVLRPVGAVAHLLVNGREIQMNEFVQSALGGVLKGFVGSLRGVEPPERIELSIKFPR